MLFTAGYFQRGPINRGKGSFSAAKVAGFSPQARHTSLRKNDSVATSPSDVWHDEISVEARWPCVSINRTRQEVLDAACI